MLALRSYSILATVILVFHTSCQKESKDEPQGTSYDLLLKTVFKSNFTNTVSTTEYAYNNNKQLIAIKTTFVNPSPGTAQQNESFYRTSSGRLDSSLYSTIDNGVPLAIRTFFTYDGSGKLIKSIQRRNGTSIMIDSSIYTYSGNILQQRDDYRSISGGTFSLLRRGSYTFDGSGNLTQTIFQWPANNLIDTARFAYDTKINPMPLDRLAFYWAPFFYNDYKPVNNPTLLYSFDVESFSNEYTYGPNNKPLYCKLKPLGGNTDRFYERRYYYD